MDADKTGEDSEWIEAVKKHVRVFKQNSKMLVYEELKALRSYIIHKLLVK